MFKTTMITTIIALSLNAYATDKKVDKKAAAAKVSAEVYTLDAKASVVNWKGTKKVGSFHEGAIAVESGQVTVEGEKIMGGEVVVDMKTITNTDVKDAANNKKLVGHLSNEDFFNVPVYPTSTFKVTSVAAGKAKGEYTVKGDFTMIGKTQAIEFPATIKIENGSLTGEALVKIDRTKWGLKYGSGNFFKELAGDKIINDEFELKLKLVGKK